MKNEEKLSAAKTAKEWFETLKEPYRTQALYNLEHHKLNLEEGKYDSLPLFSL